MAAAQSTLFYREEICIWGEGGAFELFLLLFPRRRIYFGVDKDIQTETEDEETNETQFRLPPFFFFFRCGGHSLLRCKKGTEEQSRHRSKRQKEGINTLVWAVKERGGKGSCSL